MPKFQFCLSHQPHSCGMLLLGNDFMSGFVTPSFGVQKLYLRGLLSQNVEKAAVALSDPVSIRYYGVEHEPTAGELDYIDADKLDSMMLDKVSWERLQLSSV